MFSYIVKDIWLFTVLGVQPSVVNATVVFLARKLYVLELEGKKKKISENNAQWNDAEDKYNLPSFKSIDILSIRFCFNFSYSFSLFHVPFASPFANDDFHPSYQQRNNNIFREKGGRQTPAISPTFSRFASNLIKTWGTDGNYEITSLKL